MTYKDPTKRCWAEIRLDNLELNYRALQARLPAGCICAGVIKADAYGHGAIPVARRLEALGCGCMAVSCLDEAYELREAEIAAPILILGPTPPRYARDLAALSLTQAVGSPDMARELDAEARACGRPLKVHAKLETGMGRTGFDWREPETLAEAMTLPWLDFEGVFTHFAVSDQLGDPFTQEQHRRFLLAAAEAERLAGKRFRMRHCANSGAALYFPASAHDMARPGIALYGVRPEETDLPASSGPDEAGTVLLPVMAFKGRVAAVTAHRAGDSVSYGQTFVCERDSRLAVLTVGYGDGLHRALSGRMDALLRGKRVRQVGRICMDMCMLDVTELPEAAVGDEVTIFGEGGLSAGEQAGKAGTISDELLCAITPRVPRVYIG